MQNALRGRASLALAILNSATDFAIITTSLDGLVTSWNPGAETIFGWSADEMIGQSAERVFTTEDNDAGRVALEMKTAREEGRAQDERWHQRKDGSRFWATGLMMRFEDDETGEHLGYLKIVQDRTSQHEANERAKEGRRAERLRFLLSELGERLRNAPTADAMQVVAAALIGDALQADRVGYGSVAEDGETFTVLEDWTAEGFPSLAGIYRIDDYGLYASSLRAGETVVINNVVHDPRTAASPEPLIAVGVGALVNHPVVEDGRTVAILYVNAAAPRAWTGDEVAFIREAGERVREVSQRRRAELALRALNTSLERRIEERSAALRLYRDIVQSDHSPVVAFDTDKRITAFNEAHRQAYKRVYGIEQKVGDSLLEQFLPEQAEIVRGFMERALLGQSFIVREAFGDPALDQPIWQIAYNPLRDEDGSIIGGFHHALDITAELQARDALARTEEALRQSQKLEAIGQLTGGVAHDFNNLLTVIRGSVDLLRREDMTPQRRGRYLDAISETSERAAKLTGQLLAFARRQTLAPEVFDVLQRIDAVADLLGQLVGARIAIKVEGPSEACHVDADVSQFETALVNLAVNARDAMNGEGEICIRLTCDSNLPALRLHPERDGSFVAISISDTGVGIPAEDLDHIFEPFFTTKSVGRGTGLGLSQVFGFAKQSGGDVAVSSIPGQGTTFTLYLPQVVGEARSALPPRTATRAAHGHGRHVLVVEDNESVGKFATELLDDLGYRSEWVETAEAALERLGGDGAGFDIVFSDVVMPGMGGIELAKVLSRSLPNLPVVLASGYSHVLAQEGAQGFVLLQKPYSAEQLSETLGRQLEQAASTA